MPRQTDVALFVNSLRGGGSERLMVTLANAFAQRRLAVDLVLGRAHGPYCSDIDQRVNLVDFRTRSAVVGVLKLWLYLRKKRPAAMLSTNVMSNDAAIFVKIVFGTSTRIVINEGSTLSESLQSHYEHPLPALRFAGWAAPYLYPRADAVIAVSEGVAKELVQTYRIPDEKIRTIYNPIITDDLESLARQEPSHAWLREATPVVLAVGRLHPAKDYPTLFRAFALLRKQVACRLLVLGEGQERPALARLAKELGIDGDLAMPGFVKNPFAYMRRAAVYVLSSRWEGLSNTLLEAMACGCPVVSTDCPHGPAEVLKNGRYGELVEVGNAPRLAAAIEAVLAGRKKRPDREWLRRFSVESALDLYLDALGIREDSVRP